MKSCAARYISKEHDKPGAATEKVEGVRWIFAESPQPVLDLIEWIYWKHNNQARAILRGKIGVSEAPTGFELGLIKTAAKRWELIGAAAMSKISRLPITSSQPELQAESVEKVDLKALETVRAELVRQGTEKYSQFLRSEFKNLQKAAKWVRDEQHRLAASPSIPRYQRDRSVVAALFDQDWRLVAAARNTNGMIRTRHAEMNLIEDLMRRGVFVGGGLVAEKCLSQKKDSSSREIASGGPRGLLQDKEISGMLVDALTLVVSLQCCRMCAAALVEAIPKVKVIYIERETALVNVRTALYGREEQFRAE